MTPFEYGKTLGVRFKAGASDVDIAKELAEVTVDGKHPTPKQFGEILSGMHNGVFGSRLVEAENIRFNTFMVSVRQKDAERRQEREDNSEKA
ncbi:MAG: hypothetical protein JKY65_23200 [Planctomycetes bacterium]|nr:hypothetical protein [Planctomycetota bacterium]